jgi:AraC family transcriptional regulator
MGGYSLYGDIKTLVAFIEESIRSRITLDDLAGAVNLSKYHMSRVFHGVAKMSPMAYIRRRKLSSSIQELLNTDLKIIDIALEYGFSFEQTYIRSFANTFGLSPDRFRKLKPSVVIQDVLNLDDIREIGPNGIAVGPPIVLCPGFLLAGIRHKIYDMDDYYFHEANAKGNEFFNNGRHRIKNAVDPHIYYGFAEEVPAEGYSWYTPSVRVSSAEDLPEGMVCHKIPTQIYAVFKYIGLHHAMYTHISNLLDTLTYIYGVWLPSSGYSMAAPYHFERIDEKIARQDYCEVEIYVPVVRV